MKKNLDNYLKYLLNITTVIFAINFILSQDDLIPEMIWNFGVFSIFYMLRMLIKEKK